VKVIAIVQARMGSSRLPGKVMREINGMPMIQILLERLKLSKRIDEVVVATTETDTDQKLVDFLTSKNYLCERGNETNVLERFVKVSKKYKADVVVRITGDCPLIDPELVDSVIDKFFSTGSDYCTNTMPPTYPDGLDVEVFYSNQLFEAKELSVNNSDLEHVTPSIRRREDIKKINVKHSEDLSSLRWTVDEFDDFNVIKEVFNFFKPDIFFSWHEVMSLYSSRRDIFIKNDSIQRNEGITMGKGQKLWRRAKGIIPGGNMLLSKRAEMFLPDNWPAYFSKSKGCKVWDLDNKEYTDMSIMGIGTNTLGYGHEEVDESVREVILNGNMSTLNCPEEVYLAEELIKLNPWSGMVKFARSGGEANAVAIRIARAASGKSNVAVCGYHGWHDWYLSANFGSDDKLKDHLLPGLSTIGVPDTLANTVFPFHYNNFEELETLVKEKNIGTIKMEVTRNEEPKDDFLQKVRKLADNNNIILIFDECTSGFRETFGGMHIKYGVEPDIAMFGKALGNGYAITAVVGKQEIMDAAQSTFISSTFWTERIGPAAALKTLEVMEKNESWKTISNTGIIVADKWKELASKYDIKIQVFGISAIPIFYFDSPHKLEYKTFLTQEMLKKGFLANTSFYASIAHTEDIVDEYFHTLEPIFNEIKECESGKSIKDLLEGPVCHEGFARLN
jgi:glutamate-1-semialdehyde 2,1-aminomutase